MGLHAERLAMTLIDEDANSVPSNCEFVAERMMQENSFWISSLMFCMCVPFGKTRRHDFFSSNCRPINDP